MIDIANDLHLHVQVLCMAMIVMDLESVLNVLKIVRVVPTDKQNKRFACKALDMKIFPLKLSVIAYYQKCDRELQNLVGMPPHVSRQTFHQGEQLLCYKNRIFVPQALRKHVVEWYHTYLLYPGESFTEETIAQHIYWPNIRKLVQEQVKSCVKCQLAKRA